MTSRAFTARASERVLEEIARLEGVDPIDLDFLLYEMVEVDALDALISHHQARRRANLRIEFIVNGYEVVIGPDDISVSPAPSVPHT